jgi:hypothetical protein
MKYLMNEEMRMEILKNDCFDMFPSPFVSLMLNKVNKEKYIVLKDYFYLPIWVCRRDCEKKFYCYELGESIDFDIWIWLYDSGSVHIEVYSNEEKKFI